jgi:hypothetical protein
MLFYVEFNEENVKNYKKIMEELGLEVCWNVAPA